MNLMPIIDTTAVLVSLFFLVVGSISDLKTREVDDKVWLLYGPLGVALTAVRVVLDPSLLVLVGISFAIAFHYINGPVLLWLNRRSRCQGNHLPGVNVAAASKQLASFDRICPPLLPARRCNHEFHIFWIHGLMVLREERSVLRKIER